MLLRRGITQSAHQAPQTVDALTRSFKVSHSSLVLKAGRCGVVRPCPAKIFVSATDFHSAIDIATSPREFRANVGVDLSDYNNLMVWRLRKLASRMGVVLLVEEWRFCPPPRLAGELLGATCRC
jgi:hypothetical protein